MKIAFWSNGKGNNGVTSNLACISVTSAFEYSYKSIIIENHFQKKTLENILLYHRVNHHLKEEVDYQVKPIGMNYVMSKLPEKWLKPHKLLEQPLKIKKETQPINVATQVIEEASLEILINSLYYIPPNCVTNKDTYEYNLYGNITHILDALETFADITYIDTSNNNNLSSKIILEEVDLVVVNLIQNPIMINQFFEEYSSILFKSVFLISSYHKEASLNINKISKSHLIDKANIAIIPYNVEYQEAVSEGSVVEFLSRNYACKSKNPNYHFIHEVKKAVYMINTQLELLCQKGDCL